MFNEIILGGIIVRNKVVLEFMFEFYSEVRRQNGQYICSLVVPLIQLGQFFLCIFNQLLWRALNIPQSWPTPYKFQKDYPYKHIKIKWINLQNKNFFLFFSLFFGVLNRRSFMKSLKAGLISSTHIYIYKSLVSFL